MSDSALVNGKLLWCGLCGVDGVDVDAGDGVDVVDGVDVDAVTGVDVVTGVGVDGVDVYRG